MSSALPRSLEAYVGYTYRDSQEAVGYLSPELKREVAGLETNSVGYPCVVVVDSRGTD